MPLAGCQVRLAFEDWQALGAVGLWLDCRAYFCRPGLMNLFMAQADSWMLDFPVGATVLAGLVSTGPQC